MKIWVTKNGSSAFKKKEIALDHLNQLRIIDVAERAERKEKPPSSITMTKDGNKYYYTSGCNLRFIKKVNLT